MVNGKEKRQKFPQRPFYRDKEMTQNWANKRHDAKRTDAIYYNIINRHKIPNYLGTEVFECTKQVEESVNVLLDISLLITHY